MGAAVVLSIKYNSVSNKQSVLASSMYLYKKLHSLVKRIFSFHVTYSTRNFKWKWFNSISLRNKAFFPIKKHML